MILSQNYHKTPWMLAQGFFLDVIREGWLMLHLATDAD
jgi:hypothetical protein